LSFVNDLGNPSSTPYGLRDRLLTDKGIRYRLERLSGKAEKQ
jgi:hypothetical protein